jgi:hypothetical protein
MLPSSRESIDDAILPLNKDDKDDVDVDDMDDIDVVDTADNDDCCAPLTLNPADGIDGDDNVVDTDVVVNNDDIDGDARDVDDDVETLLLLPLDEGAPDRDVVFRPLAPPFNSCN